MEGPREKGRQEEEIASSARNAHCLPTDPPRVAVERRDPRPSAFLVRARRQPAPVAVAGRAPVRKITRVFIKRPAFPIFNTCNHLEWELSDGGDLEVTVTPLDFSFEKEVTV